MPQEEGGKKEWLIEEAYKTPKIMVVCKGPL